MSQVTFSRISLLCALSRVSAFSAKGKRSRPILRDTVRIHANGAIALASTDCDSMASETIEYVEKRGEDFSAVVSAKELGETLKSSKSDFLTISKISKDKIRLTNENSASIEYETQNPDEFPALSGFNGEKLHRFAIESSALRQAILAVIDATDQESTRYSLGGILFHFHGGKLSLVATDGRRLHKVQLSPGNLDIDETIDCKAIIPAEFCRKLAKTLNKTKMVFVDVFENSADFRIIGSDSDTKIWTRQVEGRFPDYSQAIPDLNQFPIELPIEVLLPILKGLAKKIGKNSECRGIDLNFKPNENSMEISHESESGVLSQFSVCCENSVDEKTTTRLDVFYVIDAMAAVLATGEKTIKLEFQSCNAPALFVGGGRFSDSARVVVVPISKPKAKKS